MQTIPDKGNHFSFELKNRIQGRIDSCKIHNQILTTLHIAIIMLSSTYPNVNIYYTNTFFYYCNRSGMGGEWERNGSGLLYDSNLMAIK